MWVVTVTMSTIVLGLVEGMRDELYPRPGHSLPLWLDFTGPGYPGVPSSFSHPGYVPAPSSKLWIPFILRYPQERKLELGTAIYA